MSDRSAADPQRLRLWPALLIVVAAAAAIVTVELRGENDRQSAHMLAAAIGILAVVLLFVWALLFSRVSWGRRLWLAGIPAVLLGTFAACVRIEGFDGDLVPQFVWPWETRAEAVAARATGGATSLPSVPAGAADSPQFFGPDRDGKVPGVALEPDWATHPPRELWRVPIGGGWSGFAVAGGLAITLEQHGDKEACVAYELATGHVHWVQRWPAHYESTVAGSGPRATPTIHEGTVFAQGATGQLTALDLASGGVSWSINVLTEAGAPVPEWGYTCSPLIIGDEVIVNPGGAGRSIAAYDRRSGSFVWGAGDDTAHWSSPTAVELLGQRQILMLGGQFVTGYGLDGTQLWQHPWKPGHPHVCMPAAIGEDGVFISSGYGTGCQRVQLSRDETGAVRPEMAWRSLSLKAKFCNVIVEGDSVYGLDDGKLVCVDLETGRRRWRGPRYGHGQILRVGDHLLVSAESGDAVLCSATPEGVEELARHAVFDHKTWNPPTVAGDHLLMRTDREAVCLRLATR